MRRLSPHEVLALINSNKRGLLDLEEQARIYYKERPASEMAIVESWILALSHQLDGYFHGIYPMVSSEVIERVQQLEKEGAAVTSYGNKIVKFPSKMLRPKGF